MRILVVTPTYLPIVGGAETAIFEVFKRLSARHSVRILRPQLPLGSRAAQARGDAYYSSGGPPVQRFFDFLTTARGPLKRLSRLLPPASLSYVWAVLAAARRFRPDVINMHSMIPGGLALAAAQRFAACPVLLSLIRRNDVLGDANPDYARHRVFCDWVLQSAASVTALTEYMIAGHPAAARIAIVPYGVDLSRFAPTGDARPVRESLGIGPEAFVLFSLQRLERVKRPALLLDAMSRLPQAERPYHLILGGQGGMESELRAAVRARSMEDRVHFAGFIDERELPAYFAASDLFLFASASETFGIVLAQALAAGLPIVAFQPSCIGEVVDHGQNGILVAAEDVAGFAEAIRRLAADAALRRRMAVDARGKAERCYDWDKIASQYETLLQQTASRAAAPRG